MGAIKTDCILRLVWPDTTLFMAGFGGQRHSSNAKHVISEGILAEHQVLRETIDGDEMMQDLHLEDFPLLEAETIEFFRNLMNMIIL